MSMLYEEEYFADAPCPDCGGNGKILCKDWLEGYIVFRKVFAVCLECEKEYSYSE